LACGSLTNINADKCQILKGRTVTLFPDLNGFNKWSDKQTEISKQLPEITFTPVSDLLERKAPEGIKKGYDIADFLLMFEPSDFLGQNPKLDALPMTVKTALVIEPLRNEFEVLPEFDISLIAEDEAEGFTLMTNVSDKPKPKECWECELSELESYFSEIKLPITAVKLDPSTTVTNVSRFIESHLSTTKANNGKRAFLPYLHRLQQLKQIL
jgi:hypothetical protein